MMPTKSFALQTNCRILYFIKVHGVFLHHGVLKINFQVNKHHRLNTSRTTRSTQHSRQKIINTSRDSFETYRPSQNNKSTFMIHNHESFMMNYHQVHCLRTHKNTCMCMTLQLSFKYKHKYINPKHVGT